MKDKVLWIIIAILGMLLLVTQSFVVLATSIQMAALIVCALGLLTTFFCTTKGQTVFSFMRGAYIELQKIVWPTRAETIQTTMIVMVMVAVTGLVLWGLDSLMLWAVGKITHLG